MIQAVGYTDEGTIFTRMQIEIDEQPMLVTMHLKPEDARKFAGDLNNAVDTLQGAKDNERDSQDADKGGAT